jgi:hypothetical protein
VDCCTAQGSEALNLLLQEAVQNHQLGGLEMGMPFVLLISYTSSQSELKDEGLTVPNYLTTLSFTMA